MRYIIILLLLSFNINVNAQQSAAYVSSSEMNAIIQSYKNRYTEKSTQYADCILWCAMQCAMSNDNKQATYLLKNSDKIFEAHGNGIFQGRDTISEILRYDVLSKIEQNLERNYYAIKYANCSLKLKQSYFGIESEQTLNALLDLSQLYAEGHHYKKAVGIHNKGYNSYVELLKREFCSSSESKRNAYWKIASLYVGKTLTETLKYANKRLSSNSSMASAAYNACLLSKSILLNTTIDFENFIRTNAPNEIKMLWDERKLTPEIACQDSLDYLILNKLKSEGIEYRIPQLSIVWQDIANKLGDDDVSIEFFRTSLDEYGALVVKKGWKAPKIIKLKNHVKHENKYVTLESALKLAIDHIKSGIEEQPSFLWRLSQAIWTDKLLLYMPEQANAKVYFSADGLLQLLGLESLPFNNPKGTKYISMSEMYNLYRLSSTRLLALAHSDYHKERLATLYGDILYNVEDSIMKQESEKYVNNHIYVRHIRGAVNGIFPLTHTKKEVTSIASILKQERTMQVDTFTQSRGNEESFKNLSGTSQRILHIATHGYYNSENLSETTMDDTQSFIDSSMQRTGLILAGAQKAMIEDNIPEGVEDGILTAFEIAHVDLSNLDIAVLSACETALGDITKDGVAGLQRGFKMAGANSILMSLWSVDDAATCKLMTEFYTNWISKKMTKHAALEAAKKTVRETPGWEDPKYWAAFILLDGLD